MTLQLNQLQSVVGLGTLALPHIGVRMAIAMLRKTIMALRQKAVVPSECLLLE